MITDIVTNLSVRDGGKPAGDYAVSVASMLDAHVTGIAIAFDPRIPTSALGYLPVDIADEQRRDNEIAARAAMERFSADERTRLRHGRTAAREHDAGRCRQGVRPHRPPLRPCRCRSGQTQRQRGGRQLFRKARCSSPAGRSLSCPISRRRRSRSIASWCAGTAAARRRAPSPTPCRSWSARRTSKWSSSATNAANRTRLEGADIGQHLARHGIKVEVTRIMRGDLDVADALLSHSADSGADFIVMGGYGHSRLREFVLGGVTRKILQCMPVPALDVALGGGRWPLRQRLRVPSESLTALLAEAGGADDRNRARRFGSHLGGYTAEQIAQ